MRGPRRPGQVLGLLAGSRKHQRNNSHVDTCPECFSAVHRERQYLERLRNAAVPDAPDDLTARLLARTQELAMVPPEPVGRDRHPMKIMGLAAAGAVTTAGALGVAAFLMGGGPDPLASPAAGPAAGPVSAAEASLDGGGITTSSRVAALRSQGWLCPELSDLGLHTVTVRGSVFWGEPAVELRLSDGHHYATIIEQHPEPSATQAPAPSHGTPSPRGPINVLTGHAAADDGFSAVPQHDNPADASVWVHGATPWTAIYEAPGTRFTYVSDLPADRAQDALAVLARAADSTTKVNAGRRPQDGADDSLGERLQRGLHRIFGPIIP